MTTSTLGHVHLRVRDLERSIDFYADLLGLEVTERLGPYAFLSFGEHHHDVALQEVGEDAPGPGRGVGLYHAAIEVADDAALEDVYRGLEERGIRVTPVDHGISRALYFEDPDGNGLEVYVDTREERDRAEWRGRNEPFDPAG